MSQAPNKEARKKCYTARDAHFKCLDDNDNDLYRCAQTYSKLEEMCPKQWVKHFEQTRERQRFEQIMQKRRAAANS